MEDEGVSVYRWAFLFARQVSSDALFIAVMPAIPNMPIMSYTPNMPIMAIANNLGKSSCENQFSGNS